MTRSLRLGLLIAALACGASLIPAVASAFPGSYSSPSYYSPSYYSPSYYSPSYFTPSYYGQLNGAGCPKNQYVSPCFREDGTYVQGYWRNSPSDGLRTCSIIRCSLAGSMAGSEVAGWQRSLRLLRRSLWLCSAPHRAMRFRRSAVRRADGHDSQPDVTLPVA
jgi:hypothetical protein